MVGLLCLSHLSEMLFRVRIRNHHTVLRLYGVNCTACVAPLRGFEPIPNNIHEKISSRQLQPFHFSAS